MIACVCWGFRAVDGIVLVVCYIQVFLLLSSVKYNIVCSCYGCQQGMKYFLHIHLPKDPQGWQVRMLNDNTHTNPWGRLKLAICNHQADCPCSWWPDDLIWWFARIKCSMVIHDTESPYGDPLSLYVANSNSTLPVDKFHYASVNRFTCRNTPWQHTACQRVKCEKLTCPRADSLVLGTVSGQAIFQALLSIVVTVGFVFESTFLHSWFSVVVWKLGAYVVVRVLIFEESVKMIYIDQ